MKRLLLLILFVVPTFVQAQQAQIETARQYLLANASTFGITEASLSAAVVTDAYTSRHNGVTHIYFQQHHRGIPVADARVTVNVQANGDVLFADGAFISRVDDARPATSPSLSAQAAVTTAIQHLGLDAAEPVAVLERSGTADRATTLTAGDLTREPITAKLTYATEGPVRLTWETRFETEEHQWLVHLDALTGEVIAQRDLVVYDYWGTPETSAPTASVFAPADLAVQGPLALAASGGPVYNVLPYPVESPIHGERTLVSNPADPVASPDGWHDDGNTTYTTARGNNTWAYIDASGGGGPNGVDSQPDGTEDLIFDFPFSTTQAPSTYRPAAVTNLFYWNNLIHDVFFRRGFDEVSGNFQNTNYSGQGLGGDALRAEGQDGSDFNNARYFRSVDGGISRIEMYLWNGNPQRDGDFDNGIIAHEIGHGVSIRITGGPSTDACLFNGEQMGEGWSDYFGLITSIEPGDAGTDGRGIGTYALGQATSGPGIRPARYSTDFTVNDYTYGDIGGLAIPHGVGFAWSTMIWDMTWGLIDEYGFDPDLVNGDGGNALALQLVIDGLKLQGCSPGFVTGRNAILAADVALTGGENALIIWEAFARRGLGWSASQGSTSSTTDGVEAFDLPPQFDRFLAGEATPNPVNNHEFVTYTFSFLNGQGRDPIADVELSADVPANVLYVGGSASDGGTFEDGVVTWPDFEADTDTETIRSFTVLTNADKSSTVNFMDDMEGGTDNWLTEHGAGDEDWSIDLDGGTDGSTGWFAQNVSSISDQYLILAEPILLTTNAELRFMHKYNTHGGFDGGVVEISSDGGSTWEDLGLNMTENGYNSVIDPDGDSPIAGREAFSGGSGGFIQSVADLANYTGEEVQIRFRFATDQGVSSNGWIVDDVEITTAEIAVAVEACAPDTETDCVNVRVPVLPTLDDAPVVTVSDTEIAVEGSTTADLTIGSEGERALDWYVGGVNQDLPAWLSVGTASGTIDPDGSATTTLTFDETTVPPGVYTFPLAVFSNDPEQPTVIVTVTMTGGTGVANEDDAALTEAYKLGELYPNPFGSATRFALEVAEAQDVAVVVYDVMGREVARLHDGPLAAGQRHDFTVDGASLASGVYLVRVTGQAFAETRRVTLLR